MNGQLGNDLEFHYLVPLSSRMCRLWYEFRMYRFFSRPFHSYCNDNKVSFDVLYSATFDQRRVFLSVISDTETRTVTESQFGCGTRSNLLDRDSRLPFRDCKVEVDYKINAYRQYMESGLVIYLI